MYVDASAIVAILFDEPEARRLTERLAAAPTRITSGISVWEACAAVRRERRTDRALPIVERFLAEAAIIVVPVGEAETRQAWGSFVEYGRQSGHPAQHNLGDCFSLGCAAVHGLPLLYKGDDFAQTWAAER